MKEFLKEVFIEPFTDNWVGYVIGSICWMLSIFLLIVFISLIVWLIDSSFLPMKQKEGVVINKTYTPAHMNTSVISTGKAVIPITTYISDSYEITIQIDGITDNISLCHGDWNKIKVGEKLLCKYTNGRILKSLYINSL